MVVTRTVTVMDVSMAVPDSSLSPWGPKVESETGEVVPDSV
jgi:hypothetical protein